MLFLGWPSMGFVTSFTMKLDGAGFNDDTLLRPFRWDPAYAMAVLVSIPSGSGACQSASRRGSCGCSWSCR